MSADPRFQSGDSRFSVEHTPEPTKKRSAWQTCLIGCLIVFAILVVIGILVAFWISRNWREWSANVTTQVVEEILKEANLPEQEKKEIQDQVARATGAFRDGRMTLDQLGNIMQRLADSPLMPAIMVFAVEKKYFDHSGLSADEKTAGRLALSRFISGLTNKKIDQKGIDAVLAHIGTKQPNGQWEVKDQVTDEELRTALAEAKKQADDVGISQTPPPFDPSDEIKKIIDQELGPAGEAPAADVPPIEPVPPAEQPAT